MYIEIHIEEEDIAKGKWKFMQSALQKIEEKLELDKIMDIEVHDEEGLNRRDWRKWDGDDYKCINCGCKVDDLSELKTISDLFHYQVCIKCYNNYLNKCRDYDEKNPYVYPEDTCSYYGIVGYDDHCKF